MTDSRVSQVVRVTGFQSQPATRVSQVVRVTGFKLFADSRVSQVVRVTGFQLSPATRVSQVVRVTGFKNNAPCLTKEAYAWEITLANGSPQTVYRFTSHDREVTVKGDTYTPCDGLINSADTTNAELGSTDGFDVTGLLSATGITEVDLWAGILDGASVLVYRFSWDDTEPFTQLIAAGNLGKLRFDDNTFTYEVISAADRLKQRPLLQSTTPTCRFDLYDKRCTVLESSFRESGIVTGRIANPNFSLQNARRQFIDTGKTEATQYWQLGRLTWTSGQNAGQAHDIRSFDAGVFTLETPTRYPIDVNDVYTAVPGCDKFEATFIAKFSNGANFGG